MIDLSEAAIQRELVRAMKAKASAEVLVLRGLLAAIKNLRIEKRGAGASDELGETDVAQILRREIKQREEAQQFAERAARPDLVEKNRTERALLERFLPRALDEEELGAAVRRHFDGGARAVGSLMTKLKEEFGSRLDGKRASDYVRRFLNTQGGS